MRIQKPKEPESTKLCHARIGQIVELATHAGEAQGYFMVCADKSKSVAGEYDGSTSGLWGCKHELFLIDMTSGLRVGMPHLSSQCFIHGNATLQVQP